MKTPNLSKILNTLTDTQKSELFTLLKRSLSSIIKKEVTLCPCCNDTKFTKEGKYKDTQKYCCKNTNKVFTHKTNTVLSGINNVEKLEDFLNWLSEGKLPTVVEIEEKLEVSHQTAFDWRNKVLAALYAPISFDNQIIEFDETNHHLSRKGRRGLDKRYVRKNGSNKNVGDGKYNDKVFMAYSRSTGKLDLYVSHIGKTKADNVRNYLEMNKELVVYSDKHPSYAKFFKLSKTEYYTFKAANHVALNNKEVHNQTLNRYSGILDDLLNHELRGVSTKYLQGYCNWIAFMVNALKNDVKPIDVLTKNKVALEVHKQKEKEFQMLLRNSKRSNFGTCKEKYKN